MFTMDCSGLWIISQVLAVVAVVRDLLLTGRSINAAKAHAVGLVSQVVAEGQAFNVARLTAAHIGKFDRKTSATAKRFMKPIPYAELRQEIELFCELFSRPAVEAGLRKFVESADALPYLP
jgi:enoyl-CoA hydratase/carnithine racemase